MTICLTQCDPPPPPFPLKTPGYAHETDITETRKEALNMLRLFIIKVLKSNI